MTSTYRSALAAFLSSMEAGIPNLSARCLRLSASESALLAAGAGTAALSTSGAALLSVANG